MPALPLWVDDVQPLGAKKYAPARARREGPSRDERGGQIRQEVERIGRLVKGPGQRTFRAGAGPGIKLTSNRVLLQAENRGNRVFPGRHRQSTG